MGGQMVDIKACTQKSDQAPLTATPCFLVLPPHAGR